MVPRQAADLADAMRLNEAAAFGRTGYSQGLEGFSAEETTVTQMDSDSNWQPWRPGNVAHQKLLLLARTKGTDDAEGDGQVTRRYPTMHRYDTACHTACCTPRGR